MRLLLSKNDGLDANPLIWKQKSPHGRGGCNAGEVRMK